MRIVIPPLALGYKMIHDRRAELFEDCEEYNSEASVTDRPNALGI